MKAKVISSNHSDIQPGAIGTVIGMTNRGYAIEFTQQFYAADKVGKSPEQDTRIIFFTKKQVKILPDDIKGNSPCADTAGEILPKQIPTVECIV